MKSITLTPQAVAALNREVPDELDAVIRSAVSAARPADVLTITFDNEAQAVAACLRLRCFLPLSLAGHIQVSSANLSPIA